MSGLIIDTAARPNRKARLAQRAMQAKPVPNMQRRLREIPPVQGCGVIGTPAGPAIVIKYADGQQQVCQINPENAPQFGVALISVAAQFSLLQQMHADQAADNQPVPVSPEAEALLAEAVAAAGGPIALKGDEGDVDEDTDLADPTETVQFNSFDVNGKPVYEPPAEE